MSHKNLFWKDTPIHLIDPAFEKTVQDKALEEIMQLLVAEGFTTITSSNVDEAYSTFAAHTHMSCVLISWNLGDRITTKFIHAIRDRNPLIPIFIMTEKQKIKDISPKIMEMISGCIWKLEDTPRFITGRISEAAKSYIESLMPPFFKALMEYTYEHKYSWHTPGHMGGLAFLKSPAGRIFYDFFGENIFRSDLSISVPELGSLLDHSGVEGTSEKLAAKVFKSDRTYFVTNGTSTANKIVNHACVKSGDPIVLDRNCHKSLQHAITMTGATPVYLLPSRNALGIIGSISYDQFQWDHIKTLLKKSPLIKKTPQKVPLIVITNSTYDGLIYHTEKIKKRLENHTENLHFDEAWYAYAAFHPIYSQRFGMYSSQSKCNIFTTHSTHKLLAAFSQSSMIHIKKGDSGLDASLFDEAYMMHMSTSPQYAIIASLDVASKMMEGTFGKVLLQDAIEEAIMFRKKMAQIQKESSTWWFHIWQPSHYGKKKFEDLDNDFLMNSSNFWTLKKKDSWHGFKDIDDKMMMLDPCKVTLITPGIDEQGKLKKHGIPAPIVTHFLRSRGIVNEKTGFYTFLLLFSIGVTKGKSSLLFIILFEFRKHYEENSPIHTVLPDLATAFPEKYSTKGLRDLCDEMHDYLTDKNIVLLSKSTCEELPDPVLPPYVAYEQIVSKNVELVPIEKIQGRTLAKMIVPYPPGIPLIMPGERISKKSSLIIQYLQALEAFGNIFPGFETDNHGIEIIKENGQHKYYTHVIKQSK